ncbi:MAG: ABC transporter permease [Anaerolineae bacterium]|nr:ABC transporter permease [Anaerolineae bacterium]
MSNAEQEKVSAEEERYYYASQRELIWWRFTRHKAAVVSSVLLILLYLGALFAGFVSPYTMHTRFEGLQAAPPTKVHLIKPEGGIQPYVFAMQREMNPDTFRWIFTEDTSKIYPIKFFVTAEEYKLLGLFKTDIHLFGVEGAPVFLLGTDKLSRDLFSRIWAGARVSLSIGLVGVFLSFVLGVLLGGISGYFGGLVDDAIQRVIDFLLAIPGLPLWMTLAAALPRGWPVLKMYFAITVILSVLGWCGLARVVRGKILQLREEDYTLAAQGAGASDWRIITRHLLPGFTSHLIVSITFSIPAMILNETALSFLGLGMQPPAVSWGVLLQDAQNLIAVAHEPWLLIPALFVIMTVVLFNFVGDGLRDAADPYER